MSGGVAEILDDKHGFAIDKIVPERFQNWDRPRDNVEEDFGEGPCVDRNGFPSDVISNGVILKISGFHSSANCRPVAKINII